MNFDARRLLFLAIAALFAATASASVVQPMDVPALTQASELVVRGTAGETSSGWSADGRLITSKTPIHVTAWLKGTSPVTIAIRTPGGTVGDLTQKVSGAPSFTPGEEVLLFLTKLPGNGALYQVTGFSQGKFQVVYRDGQPLVTQAQPGTAVLGADGKVRPAPGLSPMPVGEFLEQMKSATPKGNP